jgi:hypothetical protein
MSIEKHGCFIEAAIFSNVTVKNEPRELGHTFFLVWQQIEIRCAEANVRIVAVGKKDSRREDNFRCLQKSGLIHDIQIDITLHGNNIVIQALIVGVVHATSQATLDGGKVQSVEKLALDGADESRGQIVFTCDENRRSETLGGIEEGRAIILEGC